MEKITVYLKHGKVFEYSCSDGSNVVTMVSGNHLLITTKSTENSENGPIVLNNTIVYDLADVKNFVKINSTRKIEDYGNN
jgi:hypothetical protein